MVHSVEKLGLMPPNRITFLVRDMDKDSDARAVFQQEGQTRILEGVDILMEVERIRAAGEVALSCALFRSRGGYVSVGWHFLRPIALLSARMDTKTCGLVDTKAASMGALVLRRCDPWVLRRDSVVMHHQIHQLNNESGSGTPKDRLPLAYPRREFRDELIRWIKREVKPDQVGFAIARAREGFRDPDNWLDDVEFRGYELGRMGLTSMLVRTRKKLGARYADIIGLKQENWAEPVAEFFDGR